MNLVTAQNYAVKLAAWLKPYCERIEIAGSIRRECSVCNDVDIVCIPLIDHERDLLGGEVKRVNLPLNFIQSYVAASGGKAEFLSGGEREGKQVLVQLPKCQLDLWFATPDTLATRLLMRTGSKEHNIWIADRAKQRDGHWNPYEGLTLNGQLIRAEIEEDIYRALDVPFIEPRNREIEWIRRNIKP